MKTETFTDRKIRALKVERSRKDFYDPSFNHGGSFGIRVSANGKKSFFIAYRHRGVRRRFQLGDYPVVSLSQAREKAIQVLARLVDGRDPAREREQYRRAGTFAELAEEYLAIKSLSGPNQNQLAQATVRDYRSMLKRDILPAFGKQKAEDVTPEAIIALMDEIAIKRNAPVLANRTFELTRQIYNWGISRRVVKANPCFGLKKPGVERKGERVFSSEEIKLFWFATEDEETHIRAIFRLLLLTGARPKEVKSMEWNHIDKDKWTIPSKNSKNRRKHEIKLSKLALADIEILSKEASAFLFPGPTGDAPIDNLKRGLSRVQRYMGATDWSLRDIRRTVQTKMSQIGIAPHIVDRVLNHNVSGVRSHYDHYSYYPETSAALVKWADWLESEVYGKPRKVIAFPGR